MGHFKRNRKKLKRKLILQYTKPFTKWVPALVACNDGRYIPSGRNYDDANQCSHDYCLAERARKYGMDTGDELQKPMGLPWASGYLKYLPGHKKIVFPLRKKKPSIYVPKRSTILEPTVSDFDKFVPEFCGVVDEILYAYKVFMLAGMVISEAKILSEPVSDEKPNP